jgi:adenosylcobinamide-GDP ribazoletransferase
MKLFLVAVQFLTIIPIRLKTVEPEDLARSMRWFPLVGFMIGLFLFFVRTSSVSLGFSIWVTATLIILALTIASGGLHLDGLSDLCDGFYAGRTQEERLQVMRDPHIGVMGVIGIVFTLLIKWAILISLPNGYYSGVILILIPIISRWAMVIAAFFGPYVQNTKEGVGKLFVKNITLKEVFIATIITVVVSIALATIIGFLLMAISFLSVFIMVLIARRMLGGINGDVIGAINEVIEILVLFLTYWIYIVR